METITQVECRRYRGRYFYIVFKKRRLSFRDGNHSHISRWTNLLRLRRILMSRAIDVVNTGAWHFLCRRIKGAGEVVLTKAICPAPTYNVLPILLSELHMHARLCDLLWGHVLHPKVTSVNPRNRKSRLRLLRGIVKLTCGTDMLSVDWITPLLIRQQQNINSAFPATMIVFVCIFPFQKRNFGNRSLLFFK